MSSIHFCRRTWYTVIPFNMILLWHPRFSYILYQNPELNHIIYVQNKNTFNFIFYTFQSGVPFPFFIIDNVYHSRLKGYSFVYFEPENPQVTLFKRNIIMRDSENSILVGNLKGGSTHYRVCVEDEYVAEKALDTTSVELLSNCIDINTQPDYHTLAGWCIAVLLSCVAVFFMYNQREKIEILYFNRQYIPQRERSPVHSNHNQNQSYSVNMNKLS